MAGRHDILIRHRVFAAIRLYAYRDTFVKVNWTGWRCTFYDHDKFTHLTERVADAVASRSAPGALMTVR